MLKTVLIAAALSISPLAVTGAMAQTPAQTNDMTPQETDILEVAVQAGNYSTFLDAALEAGLAEQLATTQDITIFAPNDEAFGKVENLDAVIADKAMLADILKLHVVPTAYLAADIAEGDTEVESLAGEPLTITNQGGTISVTTASGSTATVVAADLDGSNGVVHGIDTLLMP